LGRSTFRILVVDDYEPWRSFASRTLQKKPELQVISEASDGLEAVQKTQELQPDLIVLDIGLPTVNGIEAARRILQCAPETKILFLSQERSSDIVEEALRVGAGGYVVKSRASTDLLPAVEAVLRGKQFVSAGLTGPTRVRHENNHIEPLRRQQAEHHEIKFHADHAALTDDFAQFAEAALNNGSAVVIIATESLRTSVFQRFRTDSVDLGASAERYFPVDISDPHWRFTLHEAVKSARQQDLHVGVG
jgi:DNA-binding NarL/FixJ family response regulator